MGFGFGFDTAFGFAQVFIFAVFAIIIVSFIVAAVKGIGTWHYLPLLIMISNSFF